MDSSNNKSNLSNKYILSNDRCNKIMSRCKDLKSIHDYNKNSKQN